MNENGKINIIVVLLLIIFISSIILVLKITGVIKPSQNTISNNIEVGNTNTNTNLNTTNNGNESNETYEKMINSYDDMVKVMVKIIIIIYIIGIGLNIGICMLYRKLGIPNLIVIFTFIWPILSAMSRFLPSVLQLILTVVCFILGVAGLWYYFKAVNMSGWWAILPIGATLSSILSGLGTVFLIIPVTGFVSFVIAYIISNIHLAKMFNKGTGFTIGLVLLPFIFQPILGFQKS